MARLAIFVLLLVAATGLPGCAFVDHIPDMRAEFGKLPIPPSYQFLAERVEYINPALFELEDIVVIHHYRSPLGFEGTCDQIEATFKSPMEYRHAPAGSKPGALPLPFCQLHALRVRSGWRVGFVSSYVVLVNAYAIPPEADRLPGMPMYPAPPDAFTEARVSIYYRR